MAKSGKSLDIALYFDNTGNMEITSASDSLAALGHETRLAIFRLLVQAGPEGVNAGLARRPVSQGGNSCYRFVTASARDAGFSSPRIPVVAVVPETV